MKPIANIGVENTTYEGRIIVGQGGSVAPWSEPILTISVVGQIDCGLVSNTQNGITNVLCLNLAESSTTVISVCTTVRGATSLVPVEAKVSVHI